MELSPWRSATEIPAGRRGRRRVDNQSKRAASVALFAWPKHVTFFGRKSESRPRVSFVHVSVWTGPPNRAHRQTGKPAAVALAGFSGTDVDRPRSRRGRMARRQGRAPGRRAEVPPLRMQPSISSNPGSNCTQSHMSGMVEYRCQFRVRACRQRENSIVCFQGYRNRRHLALIFVSQALVLAPAKPLSSKRLKTCNNRSA
jgi:hypothetical protein